MKTFINVAQMKLASLKEGQFVETGGYYTKGDVGQAKYLIVAAQAADGYADHTLANGTVAVLQNGNIIIGSKWGMKGGTNESVIVQAMVDYLTTEMLPIKLPALQNLQFTNILLPAAGTVLTGEGVKATQITNSSLTTPIFTTGTGRNLWIELSGFSCVTPNGGTTAIDIQSFEHLDLGNIECTTLPAERGLGASCGISISRNAVGESGYYLNISKTIKVDKHGYGVRISGVSGANCNANSVKHLVTNDNTNAGVRLDFCTGLKLKDGASELNRNNIEIFDSVGCTVNGYYMERPTTHNIQIIRGDLCQVIGNPILSSAGSGTGHTGASPDFAGRAIYIQESVGVNVSDNGFIDPWATLADVEVTANSSACSITDNRKRNRIGGFTVYTVEVLDSAGNTINRNFQKTAGGSIWMRDKSSAQLVGALTVSEAGREIKIGEPDDAKIYSGATSPEGVTTASRGSMFLRTNGGGGFTFYVKETGDATDTGWAAK